MATMFGAGGAPAPVGGASPHLSVPPPDPKDTQDNDDSISRMFRRLRKKKKVDQGGQGMGQNGEFDQINGRGASEVHPDPQSLGASPSNI